MDEDIKKKKNKIQKFKQIILQQEQSIEDI